MNRRMMERINETSIFISSHIEELSDMNRWIIKQECRFFALLYVILISSFYMINFTVPIYLYALVPLVLMFFSWLNKKMENQKPISTKVSRIYSIVYYIVFVGAISIMDVAKRSHSTAVLFPTFLVAFSALYYDYFQVVIGCEIVFVLEYVIIAAQIKAERVFYTDVTLSVCAMMLSLFCNWIVMGIQSDRGADNRVLEEKSSTDLLTGLYNKVSFEEKTNAFLDKRKEGDGAALIIIDFDNFKHVNDEHGHLVGDQVLARCGKILRDSFRVRDIVGRVGGDEFMVLVTDLGEDSRIEKHCEEVQHQLNIIKIGNAGQFSASIGIIEDSLGMNFKELYRLADDALYEAKARGKKCHVRWVSKKIIPPEKKAIYICTKDKSKAERIKEVLGNEYAYLETSSTTMALNEISLYQDYLESIFFDYTSNDVSEEVLHKYINSRPLFAQIPVHDIQDEIDVTKDIGRRF